MTDPVREFEARFAEYVGAKHCIALCNGTATLHTALVALGVKPGDRVAVPPLTMSATTIAVLHAEALPIFHDVDPDTWLMDWQAEGSSPFVAIGGDAWLMPVSLYGLHHPGPAAIDDAAQTLRPHNSEAGFTSYSFQASKILALGEGGMLATNDTELAERARSFSSLGYDMRADQPRIDKRVLKDPAYERHHTVGWNYRMNAVTAAHGLDRLHRWERVDKRGVTVGRGNHYVRDRRACAALYREAAADCSWMRAQHVPEGWTFDAWSQAFALEHADLWHPLADAIERHGGTRPFSCWLPAYREPGLRHLAEDGCCPVAESLQPRIQAFQTNDLASAQRNADALHAAIYELNGVPA